jgi:predicted permease
MLHDLRYAARGLWRSPAFTAAAVLSLALGIGFNSAVFRLVRAELFPDAGVRDPGSLIDLARTGPHGESENQDFTPDAFRRFSAVSSFEGIAAREFGRFSLARPGETAAYVVADRVTTNYFGLLGVKPVLGRDFLPGDEHVILLPYPFWKDRLGGDSAIMGKTVLLTGEPVTVIGVLPENWTGGNRRIYLPLDLQTVATRDLAIVGRLKPGVGLSALRAELRPLAARDAEARPGWTLTAGPAVRSLHQRLNDDKNRLLAAMFAAVGCVLLLACVNVANLLLARAAQRGREIAMRRALGAGRGRIARQSLAESLLLAATAGLLAAALYAFTGDVAAKLWNVGPQPPGDFAVALFIPAAALVSLALFGLTPAWQMSASDNLGALAARGATPGGMRLRNLLVVSEVALSLMLVAGAGLAFRSLRNFIRLPAGFDTRHVLAVRYQFVEKKYADPGLRADFNRRTAQQAEAIPGVIAAAWAAGAPLYNTPDRVRLRMEGEPPVLYLTATRDYFRALGVPLLAGRDFAAGDAGKVIVNQALARRFFPGGDPIGQRIAFASDRPGQAHEIIGVMPPIAGEDLRDMANPDPQAVECNDLAGTWLIVRTTADPASVLPALRKAITAIDPVTPVANVQILDQVFETLRAPQRALAGILAIFAAAAMVLALVGVYGVMSYLVTQRSRDVGIRMALGARAADILRLVLGHGMALAAGGIAAGTAISLAVGRVLAGVLFAVPKTDWVTLAFAAVALAGVALAAGAVPARRAARLDPMTTLRGD